MSEEKKSETCDKPVFQFTGAGIYPKLSRIIAATETLPKSAKHAKGYNYLPEPDILDAIRPLLATEGLAVHHSIVSVKDMDAPSMVDKDGVVSQSRAGGIVRVGVRVVLSDGKDCLTSLWYGDGQDTGDKGIPKAVTAALKLFYTKTFLIGSMDPDDDAGSRQQGRGRGGSPPAENADFIQEFNKYSKLLGRDRFLQILEAHKVKGPSEVTDKAKQAQMIKEFKEAAGEGQCQP